MKSPKKVSSAIDHTEDRYMSGLRVIVGGYSMILPGVARRLIRIPELQSAQLGGRFDGDERLIGRFNPKDAADRVPPLRDAPSTVERPR